MKELLEIMAQYLLVSNYIYLVIWNTRRLQCHGN